MSKRARDMAFRHFNKGVSLIEKGLHEDALENLKQAEEQAKGAESPQILVAVLQTYADLLYSHDQKEEALERYISASEILEENPKYMSPEQRASMFSNMATALEDSSRKEEARNKYKISAQIYRELIEKEPSNTSHVSNAVSTLNNMGALLAEMRENDDALRIFEEAFKLHEKTAESKKEDAEYQLKRITILENLLNIPIESATGLEEGRYGQLLEMYLEETRANNVVSLDVPTALQNFAHALENEGKHDAAFMKLQEALENISTHFDEDPESVNRKIAIKILRDMNRMLENEENSEILLEKYGSILEMSRKLLASMPSNTSYQLNVAFSLDIIGNLLKEAGRIEEAMQRIEESVDITLQVLESEHDDSSSLQAGVSIIEDMLALIELADDADTKLNLYSNLEEKIKTVSQESLELGLISAGICHEAGKILAEKSAYSEALEYFNRAISTYETVRHATGDDSKMNDVLENIAKTQLSLGLNDDALLSYMQLVKTEPFGKGYIDRINEILLEKEKKADSTGNVEILKKEYENILEIRTELLGLVPDENEKNVAGIRELQGKIADIMVAMGQTREALQAYEQLQEMDTKNTYLSKIVKLLERLKTSADQQPGAEGLEIFEFLLSKYNKLMEMNGNDVSILANRAAVIENIAYVLSEKGETEESGYMYNYALDAYAGLADLEPESVFPVERIAALHARIAELAASRNDSDEARSRYEMSLDTYRSLMNANPSNTEHQLDYAGVLDGVGSFFLSIGMHAEAKKSYENALKTFAGIMELEPENLTYRSNVTISLENLGYTLELMGRKEDASWMYENARKIKDGIE
ncbi:tetratricopeptide repeat protein [Methanolobus mangrovi]|uniref:Tetratricopeptide repeat protein n=1 Tax=Methanolobus mangrovi TaxID=3072977 RepID=A0AA51YJC9_9EURY|nr:tetratricopeptide repeat protein [Methanolobus mangrovi]WMW22024.1 tetratricopeptide repeat protein [Methanolobus mangrovi]